LYQEKSGNPAHVLKSSEEKIPKIPRLTSMRWMVGSRGQRLTAEKIETKVKQNNLLPGLPDGLLLNQKFPNLGKFCRALE
jgi:hypothetical protein